MFIRSWKEDPHGKLGKSSCGVKEELKGKLAFEPRFHFFITNRWIPDVDVSTEPIGYLCKSDQPICDFSVSQDYNIPISQIMQHTKEKIWTG